MVKYNDNGISRYGDSQDGTPFRLVGKFLIS